MPRGSPHSETVRAAVLAALLAGQGVAEIAAAHSLDARVIRRWRSAQLSEVVREKRERIEGLCLDYLAANLSTLRAQLEVAGDRAYCKAQPASELAALHGVIADKAFKILEALGRSDEG